MYIKKGIINIKPTLIWIGDYAAVKSLKYKHCSECKSRLQIYEVTVNKSNDFIKDLNRVKLTLPTEWVFVEFQLLQFYTNYVT